MYGEAIIYKYPKAVPHRDFKIAADDNGEELVIWNLDAPRPTHEEMERWAAEAQMAERRQEKIIELNHACESAILGRFKVTLEGKEYEFSYDAEAQSRFNGIAVLFSKGLIDHEDWTAYEDGVRIRLRLTEEHFFTVALAARKHAADNITKFNEMYFVAVDPETSEEQLESLMW